MKEAEEVQLKSIKRKRKNNKSNKKKVLQLSLDGNAETAQEKAGSDATAEFQETMKSKWTNKERVLIFSSRGISFRDRHLMKDFKTIMPHSKTETKLDQKNKLFVINEICEMKNCSKCLFFEAKKYQDLYMWMSSPPKGPSVKFLVENVHTMMELKMTGNCLKGSRPLLSFDKEFDTKSHWILLKELFIQTFGTPLYHPKSQPFVDHVFNFSIANNKIWLRNYQIMEECGELAEIGPRMVLSVIKIFQGSFGGPTLFEDSHYVSPNQSRRHSKFSRGHKYVQRQATKVSVRARRPTEHLSADVTEDVFDKNIST